METSVQTIAGILTALLVWGGIYVLVYWGLLLVDTIRAISFIPKDPGPLPYDWLIRQLLAPGVGGFAAIHAIARCFDYANLKIVAAFYLTPIVIFFFVFRVYLMLTLPDHYTFQWSEQLLAFGVAAASVIGTLIGLSQVIIERATTTERE